MLLLPCGFFGLWMAAASGSDRGSPALAAEWRDQLAQFPDPDSAKAADPSMIVVRCENGDWVFGRTQSSHGVWLRGGGTVVMRDSGGRIRAFFGHVCGGDYLPGSFGRLPDLAAFYAAVVTDGFVEHPLQ
ncbi:hypothetical protein [Tuwongella immobilis]|uniref:hypothetical protein n=1 Tax=Tuwongella immobilis TaxID=692036 RepID=UPI0013A6EC4F|nr:hypothetical protein [Tuwongella immobilis]